MTWQVTLPSVGNGETWTDTFSLTEDGETFDLTNVAALEFALRNPETKRTLLSAGWAGGDTVDPESDFVRIEEDDDGSFISIRFNDLTSLCAKSYEFVLIITKDGYRSEIIGTINILDGVIR